jgi:hypothetical protein
MASTATYCYLQLVIIAANDATVCYLLLAILAATVNCYYLLLAIMSAMITLSEVRWFGWTADIREEGGEPTHRGPQHHHHHTGPLAHPQVGST